MTEDEKLQESVENNREFTDSGDARAYRKVFDVLKKDPYELPYGFADRVMRSIEERKQSIAGDHAWLAAGLFAIAAAAVVTAIVLNFKISLAAFKFLSGYGKLALFAAALIFVIQLVDRTIIRRKLHPRH